MEATIKCDSVWLINSTYTIYIDFKFPELPCAYLLV